VSKLTDYFNAILQGGLPAALDLGLAAGTAQGDTKPEQTAPATTIKDHDTATAGTPSASPLAWLDGKTVLIGVAGIVVVGAVMILAFKALGKK